MSHVKESKRDSSRKSAVAGLTDRCSTGMGQHLTQLAAETVCPVAGCDGSEFRVGRH